jgi:hypothetical protein
MVAIGDAVEQIHALFRSAGRSGASADQLAYLSDYIGYTGQDAIDATALNYALAEAQRKYLTPISEKGPMFFAEGTLGRLGTFFADFGAGTPTVLHGNEAVVRPDQASEFARRHGGAAGRDEGVRAELAAVRRLLGDFPRAVAIAVQDAQQLGGRRAV